MAGEPVAIVEWERGGSTWTATTGLDGTRVDWRYHRAENAVTAMAWAEGRLGRLRWEPAGPHAFHGYPTDATAASVVEFPYGTEDGAA